MNSMERVDLIRAAHAELARHFEGRSVITSCHMKNTLSVNGMTYTDSELGVLLEITLSFLELEASRMTRLAKRLQQVGEEMADSHQRE